MANVLRTIKLRSNEQQTITKSYNKSTLQIPSDAMYSTDLSQSYLNLRLRINTNGGSELTTDELIHLSSKDLSVSFGHGDLDYSPACLIKSCVLKRGSDGSVIESIPFSNIITQTMFQFQNNKESLSGRSLLSGTCIESSAITGSVSSLVKNPMQVQIPLSDLFQICKSSNFWMSTTGGLIIELEFENSKPLMKVNKIMSGMTKITDLSDPTSNTFNLLPTLEFNESLSFENEKLYSRVVGDKRETRLNQGLLRMDASQYFASMDLELKEEEGESLNNILFFDDEDLTVAEINSFGLKDDDMIKMVFQNGQGVLRKTFSLYNKIKKVNPYTPAVGPSPAVPAGPTSFVNIGGAGTGGTIPELWTSQAATYLLNGALATDIKTDVNIDATSGLYTLANTVWATAPGDNSKNTAVYIIPASVLGPTTTTNTVNLTITLTSWGSRETPEFTFSGSASPLPTPEIPASDGSDEVKANLELEYSMYSDDITKYGILKYIELLNGNYFSPYDKTANDFEQNIRMNKLIVDGDVITYLASCGLLIGETDDYKVTDSTFDLVMQNLWDEEGTVAERVADKKILQISEEIIMNNKVYSNGAVILPNTGRKTKLVGWKKLADDSYELTFSDLHLSDNYGFQFKGVSRTSNSQAWSVSSEVAPRVIIGFTNFVKMEEVIAEPTLIAKMREGFTYAIDLLEVVLQQQTKNKKIMPASVYSTYLVEPFTIEDNAYVFERQFNISQPNCYNVALLMAESNDSLISSCFNRNVFNYRYQVNNISNTSTNIVMRTLNSDYPSSLHLDKMLDYYINSTGMMKTFFGIRGLENSTVVPSILPLKIYTANDASNYYSNPNGFSLQMLIASEQSAGFIKKGSAYLIKSVIKSL